MIDPDIQLFIPNSYGEDVGMAPFRPLAPSDVHTIALELWWRRGQAQSGTIVLNNLQIGMDTGTNNASTLEMGTEVSTEGWVEVSVNGGAFSAIGGSDVSTVTSTGQGFSNDVFLRMTVPADAETAGYAYNRLTFSMPDDTNFYGEGNYYGQGLTYGSHAPSEVLGVKNTDVFVETFVITSDDAVELARAGITIV